MARRLRKARGPAPSSAGLDSWTWTQYNNVINSLVTKKSTAITATDEATTALVVARPTPCVPPLRAKSDMTSDRHDDIAKAERLDDPHPCIVEVQPLDDRGPVEARRNPQLEDRDEPASDDADRVGDHRQDRRHEEARQHARHDQLANRIGPKGAQRVDLVGHDHRAEFRRNA